MIAAAFVAGAVFPWPLRLACVVGAVVALLGVFLVRFRKRTVKKQRRQTFDTYAAVERLRAERKARFEANRPGRRRER